MAATKEDIRSMLERRREDGKLRPKKPPSKTGTKMALDILKHYKFPGDRKKVKRNKKKT